MTDAFVVDSSIGIGWVHPSQATELTERLLEEAKRGAAVHVPSLWHLEIANGLLVAVRRKLMTDAHRQTGLAFLNQLRLAVDGETSRRAFSTISDLAAKHMLSIYDAAYLELASRVALPLGSRDAPLCKAAHRCGIKVL
jgi:predicted nucleic acid-binding protein